MRISDWSSDVCSSDLLLSDFFRQCARISLRAHGKHHGGVRRQVAMRRIARRLYSDSFAGQIRRQYAFGLESIKHRIQMRGETGVKSQSKAFASVGWRQKEAPPSREINRSEEHTSELQSLMR